MRRRVLGFEALEGQAFGKVVGVLLLRRAAWRPRLILSFPRLCPTIRITPTSGRTSYRTQAGGGLPQAVRLDESRTAKSGVGHAASSDCRPSRFVGQSRGMLRYEPSRLDRHLLYSTNDAAVGGFGRWFLLGMSASVSAACPGDCNGNGVVSIDELVTAVRIALAQSPLDTCPSADSSSDQRVTVDDLVRAVNAALRGCPSTPTPTATGTRIATVTATVTRTETEVATPTVTSTPSLPVPHQRRQIHDTHGHRHLRRRRRRPRGIRRRDGERDSDSNPHRDGDSSDRFANHEPGVVTDGERDERADRDWDKRCVTTPTATVTGTSSTTPTATPTGRVRRRRPEPPTRSSSPTATSRPTQTRTPTRTASSATATSTGGPLGTRRFSLDPVTSAFISVFAGQCGAQRYGIHRLSRSASWRT